MTNEKIEEMARRFQLCGVVPDSAIRGFARAVADFIREDELKVATMARYIIHANEDRCDACLRPFWHYLERQQEEAEPENR